MTKTILIVDDSSSFRQVVSMALRDVGYNVVDACDGKDALTKLDGRKINLIVSDVNMPIMDGLTFVKAAKQLPSYKFTPVIMLTTESGEAKKNEGKAAGVRAWIVKPFLAPVLLDAVSKLVLP
ncbi:response regulator [Pseudomonas fluorescens]|uniref:Two-component system response regulator n=1 Tax=Pseudomonas fluorescens TaxID=294 RepID=A0A423LKG6_PSEFL|nr:response regulator [Pseudomonas fluorescens]RON68796.1 two-component system response regulator [Pseudomonas fluorescens]